MDFKRLNEYALETSRNELADHFDWSAFLVYSMAISNLDFNANDIEGTEIDDNIKNIFDDFSKYYTKKNSGKNSDKELFDMLNTLKRIVIELFYQANLNERTKICDVIAEISKAIETQ